MHGGRAEEVRRAVAGPSRVERRRQPLGKVPGIERRDVDAAVALGDAEAVVPVGAVDGVVRLKKQVPRHLVDEVALLFVGLALH